MANILPIDAQKKVWSMYRARFIIAFSLVLLSVEGLGVLTLVPSYLALRLAAPPVSNAPIAHGQNAVNDPVAVARSQALVRAVLPLVSATTSPSGIILLALADRPKGVRIDHITFASGAPGQITLTGIAAREVLSQYRDTLKKDPLFDTVSVPVGSLVSTDGHFTISLSGTF